MCCAGKWECFVIGWPLKPCAAMRRVAAKHARDTAAGAFILLHQDGCSLHAYILSSSFTDQQRQMGMSLRCAYGDIPSHGVTSLLRGPCRQLLYCSQYKGISVLNICFRACRQAPAESEVRRRAPWREHEEAAPRFLSYYMLSIAIETSIQA